MTRPLEGRYGPTLLVALLALIPFIVVTTADSLFREQVGTALGASATVLSILAGLAIAGYAFGALVAGDLVQRFPQRVLFLVCEAAFIAAALMAATAPGVILYGIGTVAQGATTGLMLVIALPPVIRRFPAARLPLTAAAVDVAFFGAVTAGPLVGGAVAAIHGWRWFQGVLAAIGAVAWGLAWFTLPDDPPPNPDLKVDRSAIALAAAATFLPFWGTAELTGHGFGSLLFLIPLAVGLTAFVALLLTQYHMREPLAPVKPMWNPVALVGVLAAMVGGGVFVAFVSLAEQYQLRVAGLSPWRTGLSFWPMIPAALAAAALLGLLYRTRWLPVLTLSGMGVLLAGGALLLTPGAAEPGGLVFRFAAVLMGLGAGATVAPGLWMAGFTLPSRMVGRTFALVELVRSEADFILAPVLLETARVLSTVAPLDTAGIHRALWVTLTVGAAVTAGAAAVYLHAGHRLWRPDLEQWLEGDGPALEV